ncbi:MAG: insulinase family protein [Coriobacteriia bacterium]|nr:insulinase family protein [Coriobacteriia bacterium]
MKKLENEIGIIYYPVPTAHSVTVGLYIGVGSRFETPANNGITHFLEHMHFQQLGAISQDEIRYKVERIGGSLDGATSKEMLRFLMQIRPHYLRESLWFFEHIFQDTPWSKQQFNAERRIILNELREKPADWDLDIDEAKAMWKSHPLSLLPLGTKASIKALNLDDIVRHKKRFFCKENVWLVVTGDISADDCAYIDDLFGGLSLPNNHLVEASDESGRSVQFNRSPDVLLKKWEYDDTDLRISFDVDTSVIAENEFLFLSNLVGSSGSSVLPKLISEDLGLSYEIDATAEIFAHEAVFNVALSVENKKAVLAQKEIVAALHQLKHGISARDFTVTTPFFTDNLWYRLDECDDLNIELGWVAVRGKPVIDVETMIERNHAITRERLTEVAGLIFRPSNTTITIASENIPFTEADVQEIWQEL